MPGRATAWARRYPPMAALVAALLIAALVLPSSLNVPHANPTEVAEFAPVPPEEDQPPPPDDGALSDLGLGVTDSITAAIEAPEVVQLSQEDGIGDRPATKRCVGNPPRQTEDPNSPPCVAHWDGDNGGPTWQGVEEDTITVIVNLSAPVASTGGDEGTEATPGAGRYCDVDGVAPNTDVDNCFDQDKQLRDHSMVRTVRALSRFFNDRFQTYDRKVHFWIYWSTGFASASSRRADAHDNWDRLRPFAVVDSADFGGFNDEYADAISRRRVSVYGNFGALPNSYFRARAPYIWSFWPDVERWAESYVSYICQKVAPHPVLHSGMNNHGQPRRYAIMRYGGAEFEGLRTFGQMAAQRLKEGCPNGATLNIVDEVTFPTHSFTVDTDLEARNAARNNVASMMSKNATTVLWLGGYEVQHTQEARLGGWRPEWVLAGDLFNDNNNRARFQDQEVWRHAWMASNQLREDRDEEAPCRMAFREANPRGTGSEENRFCDLYRPFFMLFRGIQVAGPHLTPFTVEQGNRAIPRVASNDPFTAACYFEPGDFSCVKDMQESWWDPDAPDPNEAPGESGCWRMTQGGLRSIPWEWRGDGTDVFRSPTDICNNIRSAAVLIN